MGRLPTESEGVQILLNNSGGLNQWKGPYLEESSLIDIWNRAAKYTKLSTSRFEVRSAGEDGSFGTSDDVVVEEEVVF